MNTQYHPSAPQHQPPVEDIRIQVTKTIWGCATGMLGISIPLVGITHSPIIPIFVVIGAALGTTAVWLAKGTQSSKQLGSSEVTQEQLKALEERLANVEVISSFERGLQERTAPEPFAEPLPVQPTQSGHNRTLKRSLEAPPF